MKKLVAFLMIIILILILPGCWDLKDINERNLVMAMAIDFAEDPQPSNYEYSTKYKITLQIPINEKLGGGANQPPAMGRETVAHFSAEGDDVAQAIALVESQMEYDLFLGHIRVVVFGQDVAREGLNRHLNYFRNNPQFRRLSYILVSEKKGEDIIKTFPPTADIQGKYLMNFIETEINNGRLPYIPFSHFVIRLLDEGVDPVAVMVDSSQGQIKIKGLAVFRGDKMVGRLNLYETWKYTQIMENSSGSLEVVRDVANELGNVTLKMQSVRCAFKPIKQEKGNFKLIVSLDVETRLVSPESQTDYSNPIFMAALEERVSNEFKKEIEMIFYKLKQQYQADICGVGQKVKAFLPADWKKVKDWEAEFLKTEIEVKVRTIIRRLGMNRFKEK